MTISRPAVIPGAVKAAVTLMFTAAGLEIVILILSLALSSSSNVSSSAKGSAIVGALIGIGLWVWMGFMNRAGKNWARITGTVFFGLDTLFVIIALASHTDGAAKVVGILIWAIGLVTVILLWQRNNAAYFSGGRQQIQGWQ
jgi:hypothetical protein